MLGGNFSTCCKDFWFYFVFSLHSVSVFNSVINDSELNRRYRWSQGYCAFFRYKFFLYVIGEDSHHRWNFVADSLEEPTIIQYIIFDGSSYVRLRCDCDICTFA